MEKIAARYDSSISKSELVVENGMSLLERTTYPVEIAGKKVYERALNDRDVNWWIWALWAGVAECVI